MIAVDEAMNFKYRLSDNDFGKAERGRRMGYTLTSNNAAKIFI